MYTAHLPRQIRVLLLLVALVASLPPTLPVAARGIKADVAIILEANPNLNVQPGSILAYKLRVENFSSEGTMQYARAYLSYNPEHMTLVDTLFQQHGDYVVSVNNNQIEVFFGVLGRRTARFAVLYMQLKPDIPTGTILPMWGRYMWEDKHGNYELHSRTNSVPVIVQAQSASTPYLWMAVAPQQATVGTEVGFFTDRLLPNERVRLLLNTPSGEQRDLTNRQIRVNPEGRLWLFLPTDDLEPGHYTYMVRGERSRLETAIDFTLLPR